MKSKLYGLGDLGFSLAAILALATVLCMFAAGAYFAAEELLPGWIGLHAASGAAPAESAKAAAYFGLAASFAIYFSVGLAVLIVARLRGGPNWRDLIAWRPWSLRGNGPRFWLIIGAALVYGFAADFALGYFYPQSEAWFTMPEDKVAAVILVVLAVVVAPIVEELVFRGWIFTRLRQNFSFAAALLGSSIIFAALHYEATHLYAVAVFPVGLALGAIRELAGSVKPTIAFHAFNNLIACGLSLLDLG
jgi:membrane protease YdiL (CAAX protease family)